MPSTPTPNDRVVITLERTGDNWSARTHRELDDGRPIASGPSALTYYVEADAPGVVLEVLARELDRLEADRLKAATAELRADLTATRAQRELAADVAAVVEVLEHAARTYQGELEPAVIALALKWTPTSTLNRAQPTQGDLDAIARVERALEQARGDGVAQSRRRARARDDGDVLVWSLHPNALEETGR